MVNFFLASVSFYELNTNQTMFIVSTIAIVFAIIAGALLIALNIKKLYKNNLDTSVSEIKAETAKTSVQTAGLSEEVVAAISTAVAFMGKEDGTNYSIKSIEPSGKEKKSVTSVSYKRPIWMSAGLIENTTSF